MPWITQKGFYNSYEFLLKNTNTDANNSKLFKNKNTSYLSGLLQFNSSIPLAKNNENYTKLLNPKLSLKLAPDYTKDSSEIDNVINIDNIYSFNRYSEQDVVEGGVSLALDQSIQFLIKKSQ